MDFVISFFRDTLDGGLYYVVVVICLILIMAIIGFIMEKAKIAREESEKMVVIADSNGAPVNNQEVVQNANAVTNVSGSVVLTEDDTVSVNTKAKTEEDNFIDFGSTDDNNVGITSVGSATVNVNTTVIPEIQTVSDNVSSNVNQSQNAVSSTLVSTNGVQPIQQVESAIPEIVTNVVQTVQPQDNVLSNVTQNPQVVSSLDTLAEPEIIE